MAIRVLQNSFNAGEVSPAMFGRIDDQKFQMGCATLENFICQVQGPAVRRTGFKFVNEVKDSSKKVRLIPFKYNSDQTCVIELGNYYARFHSDGMTVYRSGVVHEIVTPYAADDLDGLEYTQSADVITFVHTKYPPQELTRHVDANGVYFTIGSISFSPGISAPTNVAGTNTYTGQTGQYINPTRYNVKYVVTSVKDTTEGSIESEASNSCTVACNLYLNDSTNTVTWTAAAGADRYRVYKTYSGLYGYIGETEDTSFLDNNLEADSGITPPRYDNIFGMAGGISSVTVTNAGSGYIDTFGIIKTDSVITPTKVYKSKETSGAARERTYVEQPTTSRPSWSLTDFATTGYPPYPSDAAVYAAAALLVDLVDDNGSGSGAVATIHLTYSHTRYTEYIEALEVTRYCSTTSASLDYISITTKGSGYVSPFVRVYRSSGNYVIRYDYALETTEATTEVLVSDSTGSGALLRPTIVNGEITAITVVESGHSYSAPTVSIVSHAETGSGATATAALSEAMDYPGAVGYYDQRRCFAGTKGRPKMLLMSRPGSETDFSYTLPTQDDNRIKFNIASQEAGRINHIVPLAQLIITTPSSESRVQSVNSDALSPSSFSVKPQAYIGASQVHPQVFNNVMLYVAERGSHIRELGFSNQAGGYTTGDMSVRASHLFDNDKVVDIALAKAPDQILWCATRSGALLGMTYMPDQNVAGWHRHVTNGSFESICVVPEGDEDILYAVVRREINGSIVRYIERMNERALNRLEDAVYVDCAIKKENATATTSITGLLPLAGMKVSILADGGVLPEQKVSVLGTLTLPVAAQKVVVGLSYNSDIKTLPAAYQSQDGSYGRGHMKNINKVFVRVYRSSGVFVGPSFEKLKEVKSRQTEEYGTVPELVSDEIGLAITPAWQASGQLAIRQTYPLPLTIVGLTADFAQ